jgi:hypothetical protein
VKRDKKPTTPLTRRFAKKRAATKKTSTVVWQLAEMTALPMQKKIFQHRGGRRRENQSSKLPSSMIETALVMATTHANDPGSKSCEDHLPACW